LVYRSARKRPNRTYIRSAVGFVEGDAAVTLTPSIVLFARLEARLSGGVLLTIGPEAAVVAKESLVALGPVLKVALGPGSGAAGAVGEEGGGRGADRRSRYCMTTMLMCWKPAPAG
jgi:hypothetical protein